MILHIRFYSAYYFEVRKQPWLNGLICSIEVWPIYSTAVFRGEWPSSLRCYTENCKDPVSNPTRHLPRPWDSNLQGYWWPLRAQYQNIENIYETTVIIEKIKLIKEHITDKTKEKRSRRIIKVAQQIKSNVDYRGKIWKVKEEKIKHLVLPKMKKT